MTNTENDEPADQSEIIELWEYGGPSAEVEKYIETENLRGVPFVHFYRRWFDGDSHIEGWLLFLPYLRQVTTDWFREVPNPAGNVLEAREWSERFLRGHYHRHPDARPTPEE